MYKVANEKFTHCLESDFSSVENIKDYLLGILPIDHFMGCEYFLESDNYCEHPQQYVSNEDYINDIVPELDLGTVIQYLFGGQYYTIKKD